MSLEMHIQALTAAVVALTAQLQGGSAPAPAAPTAAPGFPPQAAPTTPPAAPAGPPAGMPGAPFPTGAPAAAPAGAPFTDSKGLNDYGLAAYSAMVQTKGQERAVALFNAVLTHLGTDNINNVRPDQYGPFYQAMEAAKVQP